jgi:hypothetical protein
MRRREYLMASFAFLGLAVRTAGGDRNVQGGNGLIS